MAVMNTFSSPIDSGELSVPSIRPLLWSGGRPNTAAFVHGQLIERARGSMLCLNTTSSDLDLSKDGLRSENIVVAIPNRQARVRRAP